MAFYTTPESALPSFIVPVTHSLAGSSRLATPFTAHSMDKYNQ